MIRFESESMIDSNQNRQTRCLVDDCATGDMPRA
jgi:hypothetical protein